MKLLLALLVAAPAFAADISPVDQAIKGGHAKLIDIRDVVLDMKFGPDGTASVFCPGAKPVKQPDCDLFNALHMSVKFSSADLDKLAATAHQALKWDADHGVLTSTRALSGALWTVEAGLPVDLALFKRIPGVTGTRETMGGVKLPDDLVYVVGIWERFGLLVTQQGTEKPVIVVQFTDSIAFNDAAGKLTPQKSKFQRMLDSIPNF
jgi:hypothetical protein